MQHKTRSLIHTTLTALATGGVLATAQTQAAESQVVCKEQERCYGIARSGKNDCATSTSACLGSAKKDFQKDAWIYVPKGTCEKIGGSSLKPGKP